jgi:hypothetical protein
MCCSIGPGYDGFKGDAGFRDVAPVANVWPPLILMTMQTLPAVSLPAGAGLVETASVGLPVAQGVGPSEAVAIGLLHRGATFWVARALGAGAYANLVVHHNRA